MRKEAKQWNRPGAVVDIGAASAAVTRRFFVGGWIVAAVALVLTGYALLTATDIPLALVLLIGLGGLGIGLLLVGVAYVLHAVRNLQ